MNKARKVAWRKHRKLDQKYKDRAKEQAKAAK